METKMYIVRTNHAGVFFGEVVKNDWKSITMRNVRKLHYWSGAGAVEGLAQYGTSKPDSCRFTVIVAEQEIAEPIQVIECTDLAIKSINSVKEWKV
jgi:hypothetical protein